MTEKSELSRLNDAYNEFRARMAPSFTDPDSVDIFQGSKNNLIHPIDCGDGVVINERFDFSHPEKPCIDLDLLKVPHRVQEALLGDARHIPLGAPLSSGALGSHLPPLPDPIR